MWGPVVSLAVLVGVVEVEVEVADIWMVDMVR